MLDVHPPHAPTHTWKDFFLHIATIVIGLLIAFGLEQTVEYFHHRHQLHYLEDALEHEVAQNQQIVLHDIALVDNIARIEQANKASLEAASKPGSHTPIVYLSSPAITTDNQVAWRAPLGSVSAAARDAGIITLLPIARASYLTRLDITYANDVDLQHQLFDQEYRVRAYAQLHNDLNDLTPQQRQDMLLVVSQYQQTAQHTRFVLERTLAILEQTH
jgi:hypothetical protein